MSTGTGTTVTCICGHQGFIIINARTGEQVDLKSLYPTKRGPIDPANLKRHDPIDLGELVMVCANPACRRRL